MLGIVGLLDIVFLQTHHIDSSTIAYVYTVNHGFWLALENKYTHYESQKGPNRLFPSVDIGH
jgi:hypothetical protein